MTTPARMYSWKQFGKGHTLSLKNGNRSPRVIGALAERLAAALLVERPDLRPFIASVTTWAHSESRAAILRVVLDDRGILDDDGRVRVDLLQQIRAEERRAGEERKVLGLDPRSALELVRARTEAEHSAVDLDALRARGKAAFARRAEALEASEGNDDD